MVDGVSVEPDQLDVEDDLEALADGRRVDLSLVADDHTLGLQPLHPTQARPLAVLIIVFAITLALRAVPFVILTRLRESESVQTMARWMPIGILVILTIATFRSSLGAGLGHLVAAVIAVAVTAAVHLLLGRRTLLSVGLGTLAFVLLVNVL